MKRAGYKEAIAWIAWNDGSGDDLSRDPIHCSEMVTSALIADIFGVKPLKVGEDIARFRRKLDSSNK